MNIVTSFLCLDQWEKSPPSLHLSLDMKSWCGYLRVDYVARLAVKTKPHKRHNINNNK